MASSESLRAAALLLLGALAVSGCVAERSRDRREDAGEAGAGSLDAGPLAHVDAPFPDAGFVACESVDRPATRTPATLVLQLDTSGSMNCRVTEASCATGEPTPAPDDSRWDVLRLRLNEALARLHDDDRVGLMHFPVTFSCAAADADVAIAPLADTRASIASTLARLVPEGITPTHDAVAYALALLTAAGGPNRYLVLATDGAATTCLGCDPACSWDALDRDNEALVERVRAAHDAGTSTFVIGVPGSRSYRAILSRLASAGGTARAGCSDGGPTYCHFDLTDPTLDFSGALEDTLASIGEAVFSCEFTIPPNPEGAFDPSLVNVRIETSAGWQDVPRDPSHARGWDFDEREAHVVLHGESCEAARAESTTRVEVRFGCPTILL